MSEAQLPQTTEQGVFNRGPEAQFADKVLEFHDAAREQIGRLNMKTSDHEGQLKKLDTIIASVQSSMAAWQNTAIGIAAAIGVAIAFLGAVELWSLSETSSLREDTNSRFDKVDGRLTTIEENQKTLPAEISKEMLAVAASIATVRQQQAAPQPPVNGTHR